jgi:NTP pyrophosphatase (non-canonical NTP hydrolase)
MNKNTALEIMLHATLNDLLDIFRYGRLFTDAFDKAAALQWLKKKREIDYYQVLGDLYGVAVYEVDGSGVTEGCPDHELGKFFISTNALDFPDCPMLPLANTLPDCYRIACSILGLEKLFLAECTAGCRLPRICFPEGVDSVTKQIPHIIAEVRAFDKLDVNELQLKVCEETGELAQAILVERGKLPHKSLKEPAIGEGADVIIATVATLAKLYPEMTPDKLAEELARWVTLKMAKYEGRLHQNAGLTETRRVIESSATPK